MGTIFKRTSHSENDSSSDQDERKKAPDAVASERVTFRACFLGVVASMGGFMFGYVSGQISGFFDMKDFGQRFGAYDASSSGYEFSAVRQGAMTGFLQLGCLAGALAAGRMADYLGRRLAISASALWTMVGVIIEVSSSTAWQQFAVGRLVTGIGIGSMSVVVPMYQSESSPAILRGILIATYQLFVTLGIWVAEMVDYGTHLRPNSGSWRIPNALSFGWALILGIGILFLPESPRHAFRKGREAEARRTIAVLAGLPEDSPAVNSQIAEISQKLEEEKSSAAVRWYEIFTGPRMLYRTCLGIALQAGQQLTGANYYFYFSTQVFRGIGLTDSYVTSIILGSVNVGCTIAGLYIVRKCGRRAALIGGAIWMAICFLIYSLVGSLMDPTTSKTAGNILIVFSCLDIAAFATTWGPLVWVVTAEIYPSQHRATAMAVVTASNWLWNFLISFFTRFISDDIGFWYGMVFAGCCAALALIVFFFLIESKDRPLEEIDTMYTLGINPITSSRWQPQDRAKPESGAPAEKAQA
ncbi:general substrate transporter [Thozetella sp. PMI_491]|nr:general substrate transporter [Thozetella sp. PMI_491]